MLVTLGSCTKEGTAPQADAGISITLNLRATASREDLKALGLDESQLKFVIYDPTKPLPKVIGFVPSSHMFFRKKGSSFLGYASVAWSPLGPDATGEKFLLEARNVNVTLLNTGGVEPQTGDEWYATAILGGGRLNTAKTEVDFEYDLTNDGSGVPEHIRLPLLSSWVKLDIIQETTGSMRLVSGAHFDFKPQGVLYRIELTNKTAETLTDQKIRLETEVSSTLGAFDFSPAANLESDIEAGSYRSPFAHKTTAGTVEYLVRPIHVMQPGEKKYALVWGMPFDASVADNRHVSVIYPHKHITKTSGSTPHQNMRYFGPVVWTAAAQNGKMVQIKGDIDRPALPPEYYSRSIHYIHSTQPSASDYPLDHQAAAINLWFFPPIHWRFALRYIDGTASSQDSFGDGTPNLLGAGAATYSFHSQTYTHGNYIARSDASGEWGGYALLFPNSNLRSAYRIHVAQTPPLYQVTVTSRWLGASDTTPFSTIATEAFWGSHNEDDFSYTLPINDGWDWTNPAGILRYSWESYMSLLLSPSDKTLWIDGFGATRWILGSQY